ncbi:MAG TPA: PhoD-like phosphatase N-terminal domain-containing protein, partial [Pirellulaceae bacterium]|nr:PhoD-like phosphatase N-terminal domain-containing protein [Pirellulaceae bacterium]
MSIRRLLSASLPAGLSRRDFLAAGSALAAWPLLTQSTYGLVRRKVAFADYPFQLGVASGDPAPDGMVLWTRLAPKPLEGGGVTEDALEVAWEVAHDEAMSKVVQKGTLVTTAADAHSVHVEVTGLEPNRWYFYRFHVAGETSPVGRTRTSPAADVTPDRLKFAFASCQHWETGYYPTYEAMAKEGLDLVVHLGDYIYEGIGTDGKPRKHHGNEIVSLEDYRARHAQYKT